MGDPQHFNPQNLPADVKRWIVELYKLCAQGTESQFDSIEGGLMGAYEQARVAIIRLIYSEEYARAAVDWARDEAPRGGSATSDSSAAR